MSDCPRCQGLLVGETGWDYQTGFSCPMVRCVICGYRDDPVCRQNRVAGGRVVRADGRQNPHRRGILLVPQAVAGLVGARQPRRIYAEDLR